MLNYEVDPDVLAPLVPQGTALDLWDGRALASVVGFRFLRTRVLDLPVPLHRDFDEVNLRFYVRREMPDGTVRRGVAFVTSGIFVTGTVRQDLVGTSWDERLQPVDIVPTSPRLAGIEIYRLGNPESASPQPPSPGEERTG